MAKKAKEAQERAKRMKEIEAQVNVAIDGVMNMVRPGKSRNVGELPFMNKAESAMARCLLTLLQLKRELQYEHAEVEAGVN